VLNKNIRFMLMALGLVVVFFVIVIASIAILKGSASLIFRDEKGTALPSQPSSPGTVEVVAIDECFPKYQVGDVINFHLQVPEEASPVTIVVQSPDASRIEFTLEQNGNVNVQKELSGASGESWRVFPRTPDRQTTLLQKEMPSRIGKDDNPVRFLITDANGASYEPPPIAVTVD